MSEPGRILVITTDSLAQNGQGFDVLKETAASKLYSYLERLLPQASVVVKGPDSAWREVSTRSVNVESMAIMVVGTETPTEIFITGLLIATKIPLMMIIEQLPCKNPFRMIEVLLEDCSDQKLLLYAIREVFARGRIQRPDAVWRSFKTANKRDSQVCTRESAFYCSEKFTWWSWLPRRHRQYGHLRG